MPDMCGKASCQCLSMRGLCLPILVLHLLLWALRPDVLFSVHSGAHAQVPYAPLDFAHAAANVCACHSNAQSVASQYLLSNNQLQGHHRDLLPAASAYLVSIVA